MKNFTAFLCGCLFFTMSVGNSYAVSGDLNGDGRPDVQEVDNTVDLNHDGIPDNSQLDVIKSVELQIGSAFVQAGLEAFTNVSSVDEIELVDPAFFPQSDISIPQGMIGFTVTVASPGATAEIRLHYASPLSKVSGLYRYDSINGWVDSTLTSSMTIDADKDMLSYMVTDGGPGDADGSVNGVIVDRVAPAVNGPYLVKDINTDASGFSSQPYNILNGTKSSYAVMNGRAYFCTLSGLWKSDGTAAGTMEVKHGISGYNLINAGGSIYFTVFTNPTELWKSDGTEAGTTFVKNFSSAGGNYPGNFIESNGTLFFTATDGSNGLELWKSDGTANGTVMVKDINQGSGDSTPSYLTDVNGTLFFTATDGTNSGLWKSDGTEAGTVLVKNIYTGSSFANVNGTLFFGSGDVNNGWELWKSDGTGVGTVLVKTFTPGGVGSDLRELVACNGVLYFSASESSGPRELWRSDGTESGTVLVKYIDPFYIEGLTEANGTLFFINRAGSGPSYELWKSDGTDVGTVKVKDLLNMPMEVAGYGMTKVGTTLFFYDGSGLWKSDGTVAGTVMVKSLWVNPYYLTDVNGTLFFSAKDGVTGEELWKSDGTEAGTVLVRDIFQGSAGISLGGLPFADSIDVNGTAFFSLDDGINGEELWKSDGTAAGTVLVKDINPGSDYSHPTYLTSFNGELFFTAYDAVNGRNLWKSDGTEAGTVLVKDVATNPVLGIGNMISANGALFFLNNEGSSSISLWKSDGTTSGTVLVKSFSQVEIVPDYSYQSLIDVNGTLFFLFYNAINDSLELWKSDGTAAGTILVNETVLGWNNFPIIAHMTGIGNSLYYSIVNPNTLDPYGTPEYQLWTSDGTDAGTIQLRAFNDFYMSHEFAFNGNLFFAADDGIHGLDLWQSDGTVGGTTLFKDINPGSGGSLTKYLGSLNGTLFFADGDGIHGLELWMSDGTAAGTTLLKDIAPGSSASSPDAGAGRWIPIASNSLLFRADDGVSGSELWKSDGTPVGTMRVKDINPGAGSSTPNVLGQTGRNVFLSADDGVHGEELWAYDINNRPLFTAIPVISGNVFDGETLGLINTTVTDPDNDPVTISYQWQADGVAVGADQSTFTVTPSEVGKTVTCIITVDDGYGAVNRLATAGIVAAATFVDTDGDGVADNSDAFPTDPAASVDTDGDGHPDFWNPGMNESNSTTGLTLDACPSDPGEATDSDGDGVGDNSDLCPGFNDTLDADFDGVPDGCDICPGSEDGLDIDGDGVPDGCDVFPADPLETIDTDGDGVGDNSDVCPFNKPILLGISDLYQVLQWIYDNDMQSLDTVEIQGSQTYGPLVVDQNKDVTIKGGLNCDFSGSSTSSTVIESLTIGGSSGVVTLDNIVFQ